VESKGSGWMAPHGLDGPDERRRIAGELAVSSGLGPFQGLGWTGRRSDDAIQQADAADEARAFSLEEVVKDGPFFIESRFAADPRCSTDVNAEPRGQARDGSG
jgi:hypothetical protein